MIKKWMQQLRCTAFSLLSNIGVYFFCAFIVYGIPLLRPLLYTPVIGKVIYYRALLWDIERYLIMAWGMALYMLRLQRRIECASEQIRWDLRILAVLLVWLAVPFTIRFGLTKNVFFSVHDSLLVFFVIFAISSEEVGARRERIMDVVSALFAALSVLVAGTMLYCAVTVQTFGEFGVVEGQKLCMGMHHNSSGIQALCCTMLCMIGVVRRKSVAGKLAHLVPTVMMALVVVLTQSRTSRYCLLAALALCVYGMMAGSSRIRHALLRHAVGAVLALAVLVSGYAVSSVITDAALEHYAYAKAEVSRAEEFPLIAQAKAEEEEKAKEVVVQEARGAGDASFTGRTSIWRNVLNLWKESPKHMLIGFGSGNAAGLIVEGTLLANETAITTHNAYLQYMMDFGMIGFALIFAFLCLMVPTCVRVFFAHNGKLTPGYRILCALVVAALIEGMMESETLMALTPLNIAMFFALGLLFSAGTDMKKNG